MPRKTDKKESRQKSRELDLQIERSLLEKTEEFDYTSTIRFPPLQPHQSQCIDDIMAKRKNIGEFSNGLLLESDMGSGKTIMALDLIVRHFSKHGQNAKGILILTYSSDLRDQFIGEIMNKTNIPPYRLFRWTEGKKFPVIPNEDTEPYIVLSTYDMLRMADDGDYMDVFKRNRFKLIVMDEAHVARNHKTKRAFALLRLLAGKKAKAATRKKVTKKKKTEATEEKASLKRKISTRRGKEVELEEDEDPEEVRSYLTRLTSQFESVFNGRMTFDQMFDETKDGSPDAYKLFMTGTALINSITDVMIYGLCLNQKVYCEDDGCFHDFGSETFWRKNILILTKKRKEGQATEEEEERSQEAERLLREFLAKFSVYIDEETIRQYMDIPDIVNKPIRIKVVIIPEWHLTFKLEEGPQLDAYNFVAHTFARLYEQFQEAVFEKSKAMAKKLREHMIVCLQFLTMLGLHPACIKAELTRPEKDISTHGKMLLEAYEHSGYVKDMHFTEVTPKIAEIGKLIAAIREADPSAKIIIFDTYRSFMDILYYHLRKTYKYKRENIARYFGGMSKKKRSLELERFQQDEECFIMETVFKTGGLGLNLTQANHVIICTPPYTHAEYIQAVKRAHRFGQKKEVVVWDLILEGKVDVLRLSKNNSKYLMQKKWRGTPGVIVEKGMTMDEMRDVYDMIVSLDKTTESDEVIDAKLSQVCDELLKVHAGKISKVVEDRINDYDNFEVETDGENDEFVFQFDNLDNEDAPTAPIFRADDEDHGEQEEDDLEEEEETRHRSKLPRFEESSDEMEEDDGLSVPSMISWSDDDCDDEPSKSGQYERLVGRKFGQSFTENESGINHRVSFGKDRDLEKEWNKLPQGTCLEVFYNETSRPLKVYRFRPLKSVQ